MTPYVKTGPTTVLDLETCARKVCIDKIAAEVWDPMTFKPKNNAKDPAVIDRQRVEAEADFEGTKAERISKLGLSARTGRILCVGIYQEGTPPTCVVAHTEADEARVIETAWKYLARAGQLVTFNGLNFDLPFLVRRSILLGVEPGVTARQIVPLMKRYSHSPHCDVRAALGDWDKYAEGTLADWIVALGQEAPTGHGSQVQAQYEAGDFDAITAHCLDDLRATMTLYKAVAPFFVEAA